MSSSKWKHYEAHFLSVIILCNAFAMQLHKSHVTILCTFAISPQTCHHLTSKVSGVYIPSFSHHPLSLSLSSFSLIQSCLFCFLKFRTNVTKFLRRIINVKPERMAYDLIAMLSKNCRHPTETFLILLRTLQHTRTDTHDLTVS